MKHLIQDYYSTFIGKALNIDGKDRAERREILQNAGTTLRKKDKKIIGKLILSEIHHRGLQIEENGNLNESGTIIFIIDSIKNRNELDLLRSSYSGEFFMLFLHSDRETRWRRMVDYKSWKETDRVQFEKRDSVDKDESAEKKSVGDAGQQVGQLSGIADYYIVNDKNRESLHHEGKRIVNLLFGGSRNQPTLQERSMHLAFSASNRSFCISRQVGAAIVNEDGDLLGVGHNDVPKAKGGLYQQEDENDKRCYLVGDRRCINHVNKEERFKELSKSIVDKLETDLIKGLLQEFNKLLPKGSSKIFEIDKDFKDSIKKVIDDLPFREATEYCRAVHAEMEALLSVARTARSPIGATLYVTTEPCHNCVKHIICSGIKKVVFMEPYPKSLGIEFHSDAIFLGSIDSDCPDDKVLFTSYQGIAPHRYHDFFEMIGKRKTDDGKYLRRSNIQQSRQPRFALNIKERTRKTEIPDPITTYEYEFAKEIAVKLKKRKQMDKKKRGGKRGESKPKKGGSRKA